MLINFFLKHGIQKESSKRIFEYLLDHCLCSQTLQITDFDIQRMLLKKETRFVFLLNSFLAQVHRSSKSETSFFSEQVACAERFRERMAHKRPMTDTFDDWTTGLSHVSEADQASLKTTAIHSKGVSDVALYAVVI